MGVPSDSVQVGIAVMKQKLVLGPVDSPLKQIHEVVAVDVPADRSTDGSRGSKLGLLKASGSPISRTAQILVNHSGYTCFD